MLGIDDYFLSSADVFFPTNLSKNNFLGGHQSVKKFESNHARRLSGLIGFELFAKFIS